MRISIELFLLDNWLMNCVTICCAAALSGLRPRRVTAALLCLLGAIYALLALSAWRVLLLAPFRILFGMILALGLRFENWKGYLRACVCVLLCAFLLGGLLLAMSSQSDGSRAYGMSRGVLFGTVGTRIALFSAALGLSLPRALRQLRNAARTDSNRIRLRMQLEGKRFEVITLLDSGNLLAEPITGLPIVLLQHCPHFLEGHPVRYAGMGGEGELLCKRAEQASVCLHGQWHALDCMVAQSPQPILHAQAIIGSMALPPQASFIREQKGETLRA